MLKTCKRKIPVFKAKFVATNVDWRSLFVQIVPKFDQEEEAHRETNKLIRSGRTLVHKEIINRVQGQTSDGLPILW